MFEFIFKEELLRFTSDKSLGERYWSEISKNYSEKKRHYHNLNHLDNLAGQLLPVKGQIGDWSLIVFAIAYHDIIYNIVKSDNEEQSAAFAGKKLIALNLSEVQKKKCLAQILATKAHQKNEDHDTNLFIDADLSILGAGEKSYDLYTQQIRKEYRLYPDFIYNPGRKKVLLHFLEYQSIFKTDYFREKYEAQAKENLRRELASLD